MLDTVTRYLEGVTETKWRWALRRIVSPVADRLSSQPLTAAGLVINGGGALYPKIGATPFFAVATGVLVTLAAGTALPPPTGINTAAGGFNVACYFVNSAGTVSVLGGTPAPTVGGVKWPQFPTGSALIGFLVIGGPGAFLGGTTPLDTATTVYVSPMGAFDPTVLV